MADEPPKAGPVPGTPPAPKQAPDLFDAMMKPFVEKTEEVWAQMFNVPPESNHPVMDLVGSKDKHEILVDSGHMGIMAGRDASKKLWPRLDGWLRGRS